MTILYSVLKEAITFLIRGSYRRASVSMRFKSETRSAVATSACEWATGYRSLAGLECTGTGTACVPPAEFAM